MSDEAANTQHQEAADAASSPMPTSQAAEEPSQSIIWTVTVVSAQAKPLVQAYSSLALANAAASAYAHWASQSSGRGPPIEVTKDATGEVPSMFLSGEARIDVSKTLLRNYLPSHLRSFDPREDNLGHFLDERAV